MGNGTLASTVPSMAPKPLYSVVAQRCSSTAALIKSPTTLHLLEEGCWTEMIQILMEMVLTTAMECHQLFLFGKCPYPFLININEILINYQILFALMIFFVRKING